ncbi:MAG: OmpA/MotB domain protein [Bacteroidota bacterium]|jgi:chemotaxis protein MotB
MKKTTSFLAATLFIAFATFSSCVSNKKHTALLLEKDMVQRELDLLKSVRKEKQNLLDSANALNKTITALEGDLQDWKARYGSLYNVSEEQKSQIETMRYEHGNAIESSTSERNSLRDELSRRTKDLDEREKKLRLMESQIKDQSGNVDELRKYLNANEKKIKDLTDALQARELAMVSIRGKISEALKGFAANDIGVQQKNGKIYVSMSENLLFSKGSSVVGAKGKEAIAKLAVALNANADLDIEVEGHTDSDGTVENNWTLSSQRGNAVVKLLAAAKVDPKRLVSAGRALYAPVAPNDTEANKAKNRRTDIILTPKLDALYKILQQN